MADRLPRTERSPSEVEVRVMILPPNLTFSDRTWWHRGKPYTLLELALDAVVHVVGLVLALSLGGLLLFIGQDGRPALSIYVASLVVVLAVSLAFNLAPVTPVKRFLARLDQAAIFLLIAGTYTPLLSMLGGTTTGDVMLACVWGSAVVGIALKLLVPERFGRFSLVLYLGIGWSGVAVFSSLAEVVPANTLWLLLAGGVAYCSGIIFHLWERLRFHNVLWHCFVVTGASLHLWAMLEGVVGRSV
jgi:hemolysin III